MVKYKYIFLALVLIIGIAAILLYKSDKRKIKIRFENISQWISKEAGENPITTAIKANNIKTLFADQCHIEIERSSRTGDYTPDEIAQKVSLAHMHFNDLSLQFYDMDIDLSKKDVANVLTTARLTGRLKDGEKNSEISELEFILKKNDKQWFFTYVKQVEVLEK
jgi:hypothetical protein